MAATDRNVGPLLATTSYVVLKQDGDGWKVVPFNFAAKSSEAAIRAVVAKLPVIEQTGAFVAIPRRSWKPVAVKTKTETTLTLEDVKT